MLPADEKELGEAMGKLRNFARGETSIAGPDRYHLPSRRYTRPDDYIAFSPIDPPSGLTEQKFEGGSLSEPQQEAMGLLGDRYRLDKFLARDIGASIGLPVATTTSDIARGYDNRVRKRTGVGWDW